MKVIIDRFESNYALCELEDKIINIERNRIPVNAREGDVLIIEKDRIIIDYESTKARKQRIEKLAEDLWE